MPRFTDLVVGDILPLLVALLSWASIGQLIFKEKSSELFPLLSKYLFSPWLTPGTEPSIGLVVVTLYAIAALSMSVIQILEHLLHYHDAPAQRYVIRILLMVPIYVVDSWWAYVDYKDANMIAILRDTYEAYVLYNFFCLMLCLAGGETAMISYFRGKSSEGTSDKQQASAETKHIIKRLKYWRMTIVLYMVVSPACTLLTFGLTHYKLYNETSWSMEDAHTYIVIVRGIVASLAFKELLDAYHHISHFISPNLHSLGKLLAVKMVVFLCFWQSIILFFLGKYKLFPHGLKGFLLSWSHNSNSTLDDMENEFQNFLVCGEMFVAAIMNYAVFNYRDFLPAHSVAAAPSSDSQKKREPKSPGNEKKKDKRTVTPNSHRELLKGDMSQAAFSKRLLHAFSVSDAVEDARDTLAESPERRQKKRN